MKRSISSLLLLAILSSPCVTAADKPAEAVLLNSEGVQSLEVLVEKYRADPQHKEDLSAWQSVFDTFLAALRIDPSNSNARANLAIAYNNLALRFQAREALKYFHRALYTDSSNETTRQNLDATVKALGLDQNDYQVRLKLADEAESQKDFIGAVVECEQARRLHYAENIQERLNKLKPLVVGNDKLLRSERSVPLPYDKQKIAVLNNRGVKELNSGNLLESIRLFELALKEAPRYSYALDNLLAAFNSFGLALPPPRGINYFRKVLSVRPDNSEAKENLHKALVEIAKAHQSPTMTPEDVEVLETNFPNLDWMKEPGQSSNLGDNVSAPATEGNSPAGERPASNRRSADPDFKRYMSGVEYRMKQHWRPPNQKEALTTRCTFKVDRWGSASDIKLSHASGNKDADAAALEAITEAEPFGMLPVDAPSSVDVEFTFDCNVSRRVVAAEAAKGFIETLRIEVKKHSTAFNLSWLGGAYELAGQKVLAIENYNRALEIDPACAAAKEGIKRLGK